MNTPASRQAGFTLIELLVTVAVAAILMAVAVPGYRDFARNAVVSQAAASFVQSAHMARSNAMRRSRNTMLALRDPAKGWTAGWIVYTDMNNNLAYEGGDELIFEQPPLVDGVQVELTSNASGTLKQGYLRFNPAGFPRNSSNGVTSGSISFVLSHARSVRVIYSNSGRIRRCNVGAADCPEADSSS